MGYTVIAPVGDNLDALFIGMKEFPTERIYLICPKSDLKKAQAVEKKLQVFSIPITILETERNMMEEMFSHFGQICAQHNHDDLIVNVATGDRLSTCAALSAAYANGLKAFGVMDKKPMLLPIMKLSYYNELTENKLAILSKLNAEEYTQMSALGKKTGLSPSLLSYHLNGTLQYKGLINSRLVETKEQQKKILVRLSSIGSLLLKGYVNCDGKPCGKKR